MNTESLSRLKSMRSQLIEELKMNADSDNFSKSLNARIETSISEIDNQIQAQEKAREYSARLAAPEKMNHNEHYEATRGFKSFGEFLVSVKNAGTTRSVDERLMKAPTGMGETDPSAGGFAVPPGFLNTILTRTYEEGLIASEVFRLSVGDSNGISIPIVDEQSRATGSRFGGVSSSWISEGATVPYSAPRFRLLELRLSKLLSLFAVTDELLADAPAVSALAERAFSLELRWMIEDAIYRGDGVGKPQGVLNSPAAYVTPKEGSQTADTINYQNITKMLAHQWSGSQNNYKWYANQAILPQLLQLTIGSSSPFPMFVVPGGADQAPKSYLFGKEIRFVEQASALGDVGDLLLADFSQYAWAEKSGINAASSMHVLFNSDQMVYRTILRADGHSMWSTTLQPAYGSNTLSPFILLEAR